MAAAIGFDVEMGSQMGFQLLDLYKNFGALWALQLYL